MKVIKTILKKYSRWSLPSKISVWGALGTWIGVMLTVISFWESDQKPSYTDEVVKSKNKTDVIISDIKPIHWVGDPEHFLAPVFKNNSLHNAFNFKAEIIGEKGAIPFSHSTASEYFSNKFALLPGQEISIPIVPMSELQKIVDQKYTSGRILGYTLSSNMPIKIEQQLRAKYVKDGIGFYATEQLPLAIRYEYSTIFGDKVSKLDLVMVHVDTTENYTPSTLFKKS